MTDGNFAGVSRRDLLKTAGVVLGASAAIAMDNSPMSRAASAGTLPPQGGKVKILLDTDIGSDIDDAIALTYLLSQPRCDLLGITTVTGKPIVRAMIADAICRNADRTIPIYPGLENPLIIPQRQTDVPQAVALKKWPHRTEFPANQAIEFMRRTIRANPHEIVLLGIGALTNVAALFTMDPEIPPLLKGLVIMGGNFTPIRLSPAVPIPVEWNIGNDPHAADIVFNAKVPIQHSIGLDVTSRVTMPEAEAQKLFDNSWWHPVLDFGAAWFQSPATNLYFHDPMAATTIFNHNICRFESGAVDVELVSQRLRGFTFWNPAKSDPRQWVAMRVNQRAFFDELFAYKH